MSVHSIGRDTVIDGRYRIQTRLGSGGMAEVWSAQDSQLGRRVALKLLASRFATDAAFRERFRREASAAAAMQHPNIVSIYDRGEWDGTSYIAMELVDGRTLKQLIQERGPLGPGPTSRSRSSRRCATRTSAGSSTATSSRRTS
jgi:serine/threonine-protein kinase